MDSNNWRAGQAQPQAPIQGGEAADVTGAAAVMDTSDWRSKLPPDSRQRIISKIMETVKRQLPFSGPDGLKELRKIAEKFEEKIFTAATTQQDYLRKISSKMLSMENKPQNPSANSLDTNTTSGSKNPTNSASGNLQPQVHNQGQTLSVPTMANQSQVRQQLLSQNVQNNMNSAMPTGGALTQTTIKNVGQNANSQTMQTISTIAQNSIGQGIPSNIFANTQRQMQGRQQQQKQSQNPQHYLQEQQLQHHLMSQKLQQGNVPQSLVQSHIQQQQQQQQPQQQQQNLLQPSQHAMMQHSVLQNQQSPAQQSTQSIQQQHSQSVQQQQQPREIPKIHQQQNSMVQQPKPATQQQQQQQQIIGQQQFNSKPNSISEMQQQQPHQHRIVGQQSNNSNVLQQQLIGQPSNLSNMPQQQLGPQGNVAGLQQHKVIGAQSSSSGLLTNQQNVHLLQQSKVPGQQQIQQAATTLLPTQGQQSQPLVQMPQHQLISQIQSQPAQLQQQIGSLQQQANALRSDMQPRLQTSSPPLHQNVIDQRPMPEVSSTSFDSTAETGSVHGEDWQEEAYQKIKSMKQMYFVQLSEMYRKVSQKVQEHDSLPQQPKHQPIDKLKNFKAMLEKYLQVLRLNKNDILIAHREKIGGWEKQILSILNSNRPRRDVSSFQQGQLPQPHMMPHSQQPQSQIPQMQPHENHTNAQMQSMNVQGPVTTMQQNNLTNLQHNSFASAPKHNMINTLQSGSSLDKAQGNAQNSLQHMVLGSVQQNPVSDIKQMNVNQLASQSGVSTPQSNLNHVQPNSNMIQNPPVKQQEQLQNQQYPRQMQQQFLQRQQLMHPQQQQPKQRQQQQQQAGQLPVHQMSQIHQMGVKPGVRQQSHSAGQRLAYHHQQLKSGTPIPMSSPQVLQAVSPQVPQHLSPQIDQQNLLTSFTKFGTPLQSSSPLISPSPSTPLAPSPMLVESEKANPGVSSTPNAGSIGRQQAAVASAPSQSLTIGPGISASPLLAEFTSPDGTHDVASTLVSGKSSTIEQPIERLMKAVNSMSSKVLSASVSDISSVVNMVDRLAGSAPGNGSRDAVGEDLVAMTKCRLQARDFSMPNGSLATKKMRCYTSAMPFYVDSSAGSVNDSLRQLSGTESSDLESTASSRFKRPRNEANHALLEEIREINQHLIDTVVDICNGDVDPRAVAGAAECGEGTIVKCSFSGVALSPNLKSQYTSAQTSPIQPLRMFVPNNYPNCSPVLLDKFPLEVSKEYGDLSIKAKSRFSNSLRNLSQPLSLMEIARSWDVCVQAVISEYAQQRGGGSFSSKYGTWEKCLTTA